MNVGSSMKLTANSSASLNKHATTKPSRWDAILLKWAAIIETPFVFLVKTSTKKLPAILFFSFSVLTLAILCIGIGSIESYSNLEEIWIKTDSRMAQEKTFHDYHFGGIQRQQAVGVSSNNQGADTLNEHALELLLNTSAAFYPLVLNHTVHATGQPIQVRLADICDRPSIPYTLMVPNLAAGVGVMAYLYQGLTECIEANDVVVQGVQAVNPLVKSLPKGWGVTRLPCTRATPLDVFQEGAFDYPENLKLAQNIAPFVKQSSVLNTCIDTNSTAVITGLFQAQGITGAELTAQVETTKTALRLIVDAFASWGYYWKPSFRGKSTQEIVDLFKQAAVNNKNTSKTIGECIKESMATNNPAADGIGCFTSWSSAKIEMQLVFGGISGYQNNGSFINVENIRTAYNLQHFNSFEMIKYFEQFNVTTEQEREDIMMNFESVASDYYNPIWSATNGNGPAKFDYFVDRQRDDVVEDSNSIKWGLVIATIAIVGFLVFICLIKVSKTCNTSCIVWSRTCLGMGGLGLIGLSVLASFGLAGWAGIQFTPLNYGVVPFLALGLGVDDMLVLAYSVMSLDDPKCKNAKQQVVNGVRASGPSIFLTSLANFVAFLIASSLQVPAVQSFCYNMTIVVSLNFFILIFGFIPLLVLDTNRVSEQRYDWIIWKKQKKQEAGKPYDYTKKISTALGKFLSCLVVKVTVILIFAGLFGWLAWAGFTQVERGLVLSDVAKEDTSTYDMAKLGDDNFLGASDSIVTRTMNYTTAEAQTMLLTSLENIDQVTPWASYSMLAVDRSYFATSSTSFLALGNQRFNNTNTSNLQPLPSAAYYPIFAAYIGANGLGRINLGSVSCVSGISGERVFCDQQSENPIIMATKHSVYSRWMDSTENVTQSIIDHRQVLDQAASSNGFNTGDIFIYGYDYQYSEQYIDIYDDLYFTVGMALLGIFCIIILLQGSFLLSFLACVVILTTVIEIYGIMYYIDVKLNGFSLVNLVVSVGFSVEFTAHVARAFQMAKGTRDERMIKSLQEMLWPMTVAALSTIFGIIVLLAHPYEFYSTYYVGMFCLMTLFAFANGAILLPVLLSLFGPSSIKGGEESKAADRKLAHLNSNLSDSHCKIAGHSMSNIADTNSKTPPPTYTESAIVEESVVEI